MLQQLLGTSAAVEMIRQELARLLARRAALPTRLPPILIQGETGTGKGLVAGVIHKMGPRADAPFVDVNCAAIPDTMLEAEIFGFERGAFTDAKQAKAGLLQIAHRGTIFLDEVGLMSDAIQSKLLKALEDRAVRRLGSTRTEPADAWVLAATSEDLPDAIRTRRFREDLYHRLAVVTLQLPPLRERGTDVLMLARHYLDRACREYGLPSKTLLPGAETALLAYPWPGNVRELANLMERVALLSDAEQVTAEALRLPRLARVPAAGARAVESVDTQVAALERSRIEEALRAEQWNISRTAARLGLPRNTLRYRMVRHGLAESSEASSHRKSAPPLPRSGGERPAHESHVVAHNVRWQRKRITLLQAEAHDADGSTPEHERARCLEAIASKVSDFGGRILDVGPASVKAAFGLDVAEDAARHAAHAAIAVQRCADTEFRPLSRPLQVRIALHTEEMLVGRLDDRVELDADGRRAAQKVMDTVLAAGPESILVSAATKPFLERGFTIERVATSPTDHAAWRLVGLSDSERHATAFVSRARDIALLEDLLMQVDEGRGQSVLIVGDAGIGKTRLLHEFRRRTRGRAAWFQGSAVSFGATLPLHPLIDLLKDAFGVQPGDTDAMIAARIESSTASMSAASRPSAGFLRWLLSVDPGDASIAHLDPKLRRAGIFEAIGRFLSASSETRPLVVVLEDLHWMDQATGEFLALMADRLATSRILLCLTHRTGYALPFAPLASGTHVTLSRVSPGDSAAIGRSILGAAALAGELQQLIEEKTEGNPFFVEEVLRSLEERGLLERRGDEVGLRVRTATIVPDSVQDVLLGRLERLDPAARDALRVASVVGREFPRRVLERVISSDPLVLEDRLRALRTAELIQIARVWPEEIYVFKHALTQEVAYRAQHESERQSEHGRIGDAIEQVYADRLSEHCGVLAHHFTQAQRWDKALAYLTASAQQADRTFATREALAFYDEALGAAERLGGGIGDPATVIALHQAKARLYFVMSDFERSAAEGERVLPLARLTGNRIKEAEALATIAWASLWRRDLDAAIRFSSEALQVAEPAGALAVQGRAHYTIGFTHAITGRLDEGSRAIEQAIAISSASGDAVHRSLSLSTAGLLRNWAGDYAEASRLQGEALTIARDRGLLVPLLFSCFLRGMTLTGKGDYDAAFAAFQEGLSLAERVGDEAIHHRLLNCLGWLYADLGDLDRAEELNATSARIGRRRGDPGTQPNAELNLAEIYFARGDVSRAQQQYDEVFRYFRNPHASLWMRFRYSIRMFAGMGELAIARGDLSAARSYAAECLDLASRTASRKNLVKGWRLAGEIARAEKNWDAAEHHFRSSVELAVSLNNPVQHWKSELSWGRFLQDAGRTDESRLAFQRALGIMQNARGALRDQSLRDAFEKNLDMRMVGRILGDA